MVIDTDELEIDIKDLFYRILLRWRSILAWMLICAVLASGFAALKSVRAYKSYVQTSSMSAADQLAECEKKLTPQEIERMQSEAVSYEIIGKQLNELNKYMESSLLLQLNPYSIAKEQIVCSVEVASDWTTSGDAKQALVSSVMNRLVSGCVDQECCEKIAQAAGMDVASQHIRDLITVDVKDDDYSLTVTVYGDSKKFCDAALGIIQKRIDGIAGELEYAFGAISVYRSSPVYQEAYDKNIQEAQTSLSSQLDNLKSKYYNYTNNFTADQKAYFDAMIAAAEEDTVAASEAAVSEDETSSEASAPAVKIINTKYLIIGLLVGAFIGCCIPGLQYLLSAGLKTADDIKTLTGTPILGTLDLTAFGKKPLSCVDSFLHKLFHGRDCAFTNEERIGMICSGIRIAVEKNQPKKVFITGTGNDKESIDIIAQLSKKLSGSVEKIETGRSIVYDPEALESFATADGVVLVERVGASRLVDIKREFETAAQNDVHVIGTVVLN